MEKELSILASLFSIVAAVISIFAYRKSNENEKTIKKLMKKNIIKNSKVENSSIVQKNNNG